MQRSTTIELGLDLNDPIGQCHTDHIKHILETKYQGKCLRGLYIHSIDRVVKKGEIIVNPAGVTATLPLIVEITAIVFSRGDIITGCLIQNINDRVKFVTCTTQYANIIFKQTPMFSSLRVGQLVTVQVGSAQYAIGAPKIAINGIPYLPSTTPIYKIVKSATVPLNIMASSVLERIAAEETLVAEIKKKDPKPWTIFSSLLYAYMKPQTVAAGTANIINEHEKLAAATYITRDPRIAPTTPFVLAVNEAPIDRPWELQNIVETTFEEAMLAVLEDYCAQLRCVREMIDVYSTPALITDHANLWNIYKMNKLDAK